MERVAKNEYDLIVIGSGGAGSTAATTAASMGKRIALVERDKLGGTCLNYGCDPTKTLLYAAHLLHHARRASALGLRIPQAEADWAAVKAHVRDVQEIIRGGTSDQARADIAAQGIDLFMGFALGPILGSMDPRERTAVFMRLMPRMTFLMPVLAGVTATAGFQLTEHMGFSLVSPWILAALVVTGLLAVQGFAVLLPNEIRIFRELLSDTPDVNRISRLGMQNAKLGGVQGVFQLAIIFVMAAIRFY